MKKIYSLLVVACLQLTLVSGAVAQQMLKVATDAYYPPFEYIGEEGEIMGIEADLLREIAAKQGFTVNIQNQPRKTWVETLNNGEFDIWASAFYESPQVSENADMTEPFMEAYVTVVMLENEKNKDIQSIEDFQGRKLAVSKYYGQPMIDLAARIAGSPDNVIVLDTFFLSIRSMFAGKADAVLGANYVQAYYIKQIQEEKGIKARFFLVPDQAPRQLVFLVKKGNTALLEKLNKGIEAAKIDGTIQKLQAEWLSAWQAVK